MTKKKSGNSSYLRGFTLLEIVIVIVLLGALILPLFTSVTGQLQKARDGRRKIDFSGIERGLYEYYDTTNCFPQNLPACNSNLSFNGDTYISAVHCDPSFHTPYVYISNGTNCSPYFELYTNLEVISDPSIDWVGCRQGCGPQCQYNYGIASYNRGVSKCGPTPTPAPTIQIPTSAPTLTPLQYACSPGLNHCDLYDDPGLSQCPKVYPNDPTCQNQCSIPANRCKNSSGKHVPG